MALNIEEFEEKIQHLIYKKELLFCFKVFENFNK